jgi:hypothetical protein
VVEAENKAGKLSNLDKTDRTSKGQVVAGSREDQQAVRICNTQGLRSPRVKTAVILKTSGRLGYGISWQRVPLPAQEL